MTQLPEKRSEWLITYKSSEKHPIRQRLEQCEAEIDKLRATVQQLEEQIAQLMSKGGKR